MSAYREPANVKCKSNGAAYSYEYDALNRLTSAKENGTIKLKYTYDSMGNPLNWHNASAFTWEGRKLKSLTKMDGTVISYAYDENGIRTGKTAGSENVSYVLDGTKIVREIRSAYTLTFLYDNSGTLIGFNYNNGTTSADYYYGIDNWGNINYIYDSTGAVVVTYKYDAWGKAISTTGTLAGTIGAINPYRYKSYYYDAETGLYYLQSRYYDAQVQRFVSPDQIECLGVNGNVCSYNLYNYCENDPINRLDKGGFFSIPSFLVAVAIDAAIFWISGHFNIVWMSYTAPLKFMSKRLAAKYFSKFIAPVLNGLIGILKPFAVKALQWIGKKSLAAAFNMGVKSALAFFISEPLKVITAITSVGGLIAAILDYVTDRNFNKRIKLW